MPPGEERRDHERGRRAAPLDRHRLRRRRPPGADRGAARRAPSDHGAEQVVAILCDPDGAPIEVAETLLSTEYGPTASSAARRWSSGSTTRGQPIRGAGSLISASAVHRPGLDSERRLLPLVARRPRGPRPLRGRARAMPENEAGIEVVVSDFGGVLTSRWSSRSWPSRTRPGSPPRRSARRCRRRAEANGDNPLFEMERGEITEVAFLEKLTAEPRAAARPPLRSCTASKRSTSRRCSRTRR